MLSEPTQRMENCLNTNWQQLEMLVEILQQHSLEQAEEIFTMYSDPRQKGRIILTEAQFNLVKKVYTRCFISNRFSLNDDQLILQFFMNLKALYSRIQKQHTEAHKA